MVAVEGMDPLVSKEPAMDKDLIEDL